MKEALKIAWPAVVESFFLALAGLIDSYMVAGLGPEKVASVGLSTQPKFFALAIFFGMNVATSALVARRFGEKNKEDANRVLKTAVIWAAILSIIVGLIMVLLADPIIHLCGSEPETHADGVTYMRIIIGFQVFTVLTNIINSAQRGAGDTKITMRTNLISSAVNICFNYLLIQGNLGFPRLEVRGAAIATVLGYAVAAAISIITLFKKDAFVSIPFILEKKIKSSFKTLKQIFSIGSSVIIEELLMRFGFFATAYMAAKMGTNPFAAHNVGMNLMSLSFAFGNGLQAASVALVGKSLGERRPDLAKDYALSCQIFGLVMSCIITVVYFVFGRAIYSIFFVEEDIIEIGAEITRVMSVVTFFQVQAVIVAGSLRGAGDTKFPAKICILSTTVPRTAVSYASAFLLCLGLKGVWFGLVADFLFRFVFLFARFRKGKWMNIVI